MENNQAFIGKLSVINDIEGAENIKSAVVELNGVPITTVVVGKDTIPGTLVVYFDSNLCIEQDIIDELDKLNPNFKDPDFKSIGTYLGKNNRVRVVRLRGQISNGLVIELDKFIKLFPQIDFVEGFAFTELNNIPVCHKYTPPVKSVNNSGKNQKHKKDESKIVPGHFPEHIDTDQLIRNINRVNPDDVIWVSRKMHGTSSRTGNVLVTRKLTILEKIAKVFGARINDTEYHYVYGSRRVTKKIVGIENKSEKAHFYSTDLWSEIGNSFFFGKLNKGEVVYYEIVGYTPDGAPIQKIGKNVYNYGAKEKEAKIFVYRFQTIDEDGNAIEYSTRQVKERCNQLGVECVQEFYYGRAKDMYPDLDVDENWHVNFLANLKRDFLEKNCLDCVNVNTADEGIVLRREIGGIDSFKLKSEKFLLGESEAAVKDLITDMEEEQ